jgi:lipid-A-disaccharide synthase-like uncharacterized protein
VKNILPVILFLSLFLAPFLAGQVNVLGRLTDGVIAAIAGVVVWRLIGIGGLKLLPLRYVLVFLLFAYVVGAGLFVNEVEPLVTIAGIRTYFKYVPLFLLPFAFHYTKENLRMQFVVLVGLGILQLPVAAWQRFFEFKHLFTGDVITGTLSISNSLSIILVALITVLTAMYLRRHLSLSAFAILALLLFLPCTLNETKVTAFLLPLGISAVVYVLRRDIALKSIVIMSVSGLLLLATFIVVYDRLYSPDGNVGFSSVVTEEKYNKYNLRGVETTPNALRDDEEIVGAIKWLKQEDVPVGRFDSFQLALKALYDDDMARLFLGLGIGNVNSTLGRGGAFNAIDEQLGGTMTSLGMLVWETGLLGAMLYLSFLLLILTDTAALARQSENWRALSAGWVGVTLIVIATVPYNNMFHFEEITGLFVYFGGLVAVSYTHLTLPTTPYV